MTKDVFEENKELRRTLYVIEKALLDFRLTQLDLPNATPVPLGMQRVSYEETPVCNCGNDGCNCEEEKEVLKEQIAELTKKLKEANEKLENKEVEISNDVPTGFPGDFPADDEEEIIYENGFATVAEEPVEKEEVKKERKPRKERGGSVFTDFKNLELDNNDFEGNSIVYSKR